MFGGQLQFSSDCAGSRKQPAQRGQAHNVDLLIVMTWGLDSRVAGNKEVSVIGSHLGDTVEAEQEKPRSSGEEQGGGTWGRGVQKKRRAGLLRMLGTGGFSKGSGRSCVCAICRNLLPAASTS